jgi:putative transposase
LLSGRQVTQSTDLYSNGSPAAIVKDYLPRHPWQEWRFTSVPDGFWDDPANFPVVPPKAQRNERKSPMNEYERLQHTLWECKSHVVFIPQYRRKVLFDALRKELGAVFRELARQKDCRIEEGHLRPDHVHRLLSIPPKYSVAGIVGALST